MRDDARDLIKGLTIQLQSLNINLQQQLQVQQTRLHSDQALAGYMAHYTTKFEESVEQIEKLDAQTARLEGRLAQLDGRIVQLIQAIQGDEAPVPLPIQPERGRAWSSPGLSPGQVMGGVVGWGFDQYINSPQGRGGRGRPR